MVKSSTLAGKIGSTIIRRKFLEKSRHKLEAKYYNYMFIIHLALYMNSPHGGYLAVTHAKVVIQPEHIYLRLLPSLSQRRKNGHTYSKIISDDSTKHDEANAGVHDLVVYWPVQRLTNRLWLTSESYLDTFSFLRVTDKQTGLP